MVGHTHEDVDQMFSNISRRLKYNSTPTLKELHQEIKSSYTPVPTVKHLTALWDYRDGIFHHREKLSGHQTPHLFAITESDGKVIMHYKDWSLRSVNYQDLDITNLAKSVISRPPVVNVIDVRFVAELDAMALSLCKWKNQGRILGPSIEWWSGYIQYLRTTGHLPETPCLEKFRKFKPYSVVASPLPPELSHIIENYAMKTRKTSKVCKCLIRIMNESV
ncbi:hypothetical protein KUTeg_012600 [Tegillarca granosa]|uniref:DUF7869 domain-containing protein n=1 Tax=Tegillarca granosa TaxID=220873 RepID=A0ABQ9F3K4_TEGGR|nr:hypothetical protein KUTeg_012600 [Tegillarca granosa]